MFSIEPICTSCPPLTACVGSLLARCRAGLATRDSGLRLDIVAAAGVALGITLFHARGLRPGYTFLPVDLATSNLPWRPVAPAALHNPLISDPLYEFYAFLAFAVTTVRQGDWPLWNPYILLVLLC